MEQAWVGGAASTICWYDVRRLGGVESGGKTTFTRDWLLYMQYSGDVSWNSEDVV